MTRNCTTNRRRATRDALAYNERVTRLRLIPGFLALLLSVNAAFPAAKLKPFKLRTPQGATVSLRDFSNKVTLVSFFFPGCIHCNAALPEVQKVYDKYKDQGMSAVWVNVVPDQEKLIADWLAKRNFTVPVVLGDSQEGIMRDYGLKATPTHYLLNAGGEILFTQAGYKKGDERQLEEAIRKALVR
jgi:thiol-disulfide isomerase/thioredoxin